MIREFFWRTVAYIVTRPAVTDWLIRRAQKTQYKHIHGLDGSLYMGRWWLLNPYPHSDERREVKDAWERSWHAKLPSVRIHHIMRPDGERHCHDHPWDARTIVLREWYDEERPLSQVPNGVSWWPSFGASDRVRAGFTRERGYTGPLLFGQYHRITEVAPGGVWTLFITFKKQGDWGFLVDGNKVPWREYLGEGA
jgi:hypothetical protein